MSKILINQYYQNVEKAIQHGKSYNEQSIRIPFFNLLNAYAQKQNYEMIAEVSVNGTKGSKVRPDGVMNSHWGLTIGLWESKDSKDDFDEEIDKKIKAGYPLTNILFEDSHTAILYQYGQEAGRAMVKDADALHQLLTNFINFKSEAVNNFLEAIEKFKADIPKITDKLREKIGESRENNKAFIAEQEKFYQLCRAEINPDITLEDIREMMIQHILTSDIFNKVFDDAAFHQHNTIAAELEKLIGFLFSYAERRNLLDSISHYYEAINANATSITDHRQKQRFLKVLYENFYKSYNPKAADRLGVVYTPNEIVQFMVQSTDYLLHRHFGKTLADKDVDILDPATGTGTFINEIIENAIPKHQLAYKYKHELHANEVAILPYYIANLNIEYTYKQKMGYYEEFPNLCFVDTLDNTEALNWARRNIDQGIMPDFFALTSENTERIKRQNSRKISVVIGNPPYNANQLNENENNKNRAYPIIDKRIKNTYAALSKANNKANLYDMYTRFYRWACDRVDKNGIICLITNNSFINAKAFDGFRKTIELEFDYAYIIDLGGNIREHSGKDGIWMNEDNTIFGKAAAVGIAIMLLIKQESVNQKNCIIKYVQPCDLRAKRIEKLEFLKSFKFENIEFKNIIPSKRHDWIELSDNNFDGLISIADESVKKGKTKEALFELYSLGVNTNRDEWVYDFSKERLIEKIRYFINKYNDLIAKNDSSYPTSIKWSSSLKDYFKRKLNVKYSDNNVGETAFRPFVKVFHYKEKILNHRLTDIHYRTFGKDLNKANLLICFNVNGKGFYLLTSNKIVDLHYTGDCQYLPLYTYDKEGNRKENITDWGLAQFRQHYSESGLGGLNDEHDFSASGKSNNHSNQGSDKKEISKEDIFHYTYAVLHNPAYRKKYELNLKREFPRLPFYTDFHKWAQWGKALMELHIGYEQKMLYPLTRVEASSQTKSAKPQAIFPEAKEPEAMFTRKPKLKVKLKALKAEGIIEIDE